MAVTITPVLSGTTSFVCDVTWSADADANTGAIAHGLPALPIFWTITAFPSANLNALSNAVIVSVDATNVEAKKRTTAGSGSPTPQARVIVSLPHSIIK